MKPKRKITSLLLCAAMLLSLFPTAAFAEESVIALDEDAGSPPAEQEGELNPQEDQPHNIGETPLSIGADTCIGKCEGHIITGTSDANTITVTGGTHNITLRDVNIDVSRKDACAFSIETGATVHLTLENTNALTCDRFLGPFGHAGLQVPSGATLTITGTGSLTATGSSGGAGIGGKGGKNGLDASGNDINGGDCGDITITGGKVTATGDAGGAGIGGGGGSQGQENNRPVYGNGGDCGNITISGGEITATGDGNGAGIGGGGGKDSSKGGDGGDITISGGRVSAEGVGAGIGGGGGGSNGENGSFSTTGNGMAVIFAGSNGGATISDRSGEESWKGIIIEGVSYNEIFFSVDPPNAAIIAQNGMTNFGNRWTVGEDSTLTINSPGGFHNLGTINNKGKIECHGTTINGNSMGSGTGTINNNGTIHCYGTIKNGTDNSEGIIKNNGTIHCYGGTIQNHDTNGKIEGAGDVVHHATGVTLDSTELSLEAGKTASLAAKITPHNAEEKTVKWTSDDLSVATVDDSGKVTAVAAGTATITATVAVSGGTNCTATCTVTVTGEPVTSYTVTVNDSYAAASGAGNYAKDATVTINAGSRSGYSFSGWTSSDGVTFTDPNSPTTTFTMPEKAVTVTANWTYIGSPVIPTYDYYTITATAGAGGSISPSGEISIREGRDKTFTLTPEEGYEVSDILIDGKSAGAAEVYTVENIRKDTTVEAVFAETEEHRNARLKAGVENTSIKAWSSAEKGKIKVNWKKSYGFKVDGYEIFRSAKKNTGYGTKAFFKTTKTRNPGWYKNTKQLKKGARYYYKVRGYRTIGGEKVYTRWSNSACRIAK